MKYIKAKYRIVRLKNAKKQEVVYVNDGYVCISNDSIRGLFTLDAVTMDISNGKIFLFLQEFDTDIKEYYSPVEYSTLENRFYSLDSGHTYNFICKKDNLGLQLSLLHIVKNPEKEFELSIAFEKVFHQ